MLTFGMGHTMKFRKKNKGFCTSKFGCRHHITLSVMEVKEATLLISK